MNTRHLSFQIIARPKGVSSPHAYLVVNGRGVPHEPLTVFYEEMQQQCDPATMYSMMDSLLSFFSFLEQQAQDEEEPQCADEEWSCSIYEMETMPFQSGMVWAGSPSRVQAAVRSYLHKRWGCLTRQDGRYEIILLPPFMRGGRQISLFLAALRRFYRSSMERGYYCYRGSPAEAFRLPLCSRLWQAIACH